MEKRHFSAYLLLSDVDVLRSVELFKMEVVHERKNISFQSHDLLLLGDWIFFTVCMRVAEHRSAHTGSHTLELILRPFVTGVLSSLQISTAGRFTRSLRRSLRGRRASDSQLNDSKFEMSCTKHWSCRERGLSGVRSLMVVVFSSTIDFRLQDSTTITAVKEVKSSLVTSRMIHCCWASLTEQDTTYI